MQSQVSTVEEWTSGWQRRFLGLAQHVSSWSKDGSTKCGAVIVRPNKSIASVGFNGFPQGIADHPDYLKRPDPQYRAEKLKRVIHAEMNALLFLPERVPYLAMYVWPMVPCHRCAVHIIQAGIAWVYAPRVEMPERHGYLEVDLSRQLFKEAGVHLEEIDYEVGSSYSVHPADDGVSIGSRQERPDDLR